MTKSYHSGWDYFTPGPGEVEEMSCRVCKSKMDVRRNVDGPTGWAESMGKGKHLHDVFSCPHSQEKWHQQVIRLLQRARDEVSKKLAAIIRQEAREILDARKAVSGE